MQPPASLYQLCGLLLEQESVQLEQVLPHLSPTVAKLQEINAKETARLLAQAKNIGKVSLSGGEKSLADFGSLDGDSGVGAPVVTEKEKEEEDDEELPFEALQPLGVLCAVLRLRLWPTAQRIMDELEGIDTARYEPVASALCDLLEWVIAPAYGPISLQASTQTQTASDTFSQTIEMHHSPEEKCVSSAHGCHRTHT